MRDEFWEDLKDKIHSHKRSQPFLGEFNAQLLDELSSTEGAVGPQFRWEKTLEEESQENEGEGDSSHVKFFELIFQEDLCLPQAWMEKDFKQRITHTRPAGEQVQLDHAVAPTQWKNIVTDVSTVQGAALNSNHYLSKRTKPIPKWAHGGTEEGVQRAVRARDVSPDLEFPKQPRGLPGSSATANAQTSLTGAGHSTQPPLTASA